LTDMLQQKIWAGYRKSAERLGVPCQLYRPQSPGPVRAGENELESLPIFVQPYGSSDRPQGYGENAWKLFADGAKLAVGDYLAADGRIWFVAALQPLLPLLAILCPRIISGWRAGRPADPLFPGYGGAEGGVDPLFSGWPASILQGGKGDRSEAGLPEDIRAPWWAICLPAIPTVILRTGDRLSDDLGRMYLISSAELSDLGWRLLAQQIVM